jgi:OmcA/MtrC family decaheme c-type cytochrome
MIHAIHGAGHRTQPFQVYGFRNAPHDFSDVAYPAEASDCEACHVGGSHAVPLADSVLATTVDTQATVSTANPFGTGDFVPDDGSAGDPGDDGNVTATAAVCSACHDTLQAGAHMLSNGAGISLEMPGTGASGAGTSGFVVLQRDVDVGTVIETCGVCHGAGRIADVNVVHGLAEVQ